MVVGMFISVASFASAISNEQISPLSAEQVSIVAPSMNNTRYPLLPKAGIFKAQTAPTLVPHPTAPEKISPVIPNDPTAAPTIPLQNRALTATPLPTATPAPIWIPDRILIPEIKLDAPVIEAKQINITYQNDNFIQWVAPNAFAAGELASSAPLGMVGNTVLIGHHNIYGEVFAHLVDLEAGDTILVYSGEHEFKYTIALKMILKERFEPAEVRLKNAEWIAPSLDERLTLVTCWPHNSNTHRLIIVAVPENPYRFEPDNSK